MKNELFFGLLQTEIKETLERYKHIDPLMTHHKKEQNNYGYAILVWFLDFYGQKSSYQSYLPCITEGKDDSACDIIFSKKDSSGKKDVFYVVQSKYREKPIKIDKKEFSYTLSEFEVLLKGRKEPTKNENFNQKYTELRKHLEKNGLVKFIFFTLAHNNPDLQAAVNYFNHTYAPNVSLEVIGLEQIRLDYIEFKYKGITSTNPLEHVYYPESVPISLEIERDALQERDIFQFKGREEASIFLVSPKTIYELFKKFRFGLFHQNVRNPLPSSNYNPQIVDTLLNKPASFWFFNNGITAITQILPKIGVQAKKIQIEGLQIINGAQTIYSVFSAYEKARPAQQKVMDKQVRIMFRLVETNDKEFIDQITRYTNQQNQMLARDFWANDAIQKRLQLESFETNIWYEKRRGEFRTDIPELDYVKAPALDKYQIKTISNEELAQAYAVFYLQRPELAMRTDDYFYSENDRPTGLYEQIFNHKTNYKDIWVSYQLKTRFFKSEILNFFDASPNILGIPFEVLKDSDTPFKEKFEQMSKIFGQMFKFFPHLAFSGLKVILKNYYESVFLNQNGKSFDLISHLYDILEKEYIYIDKIKELDFIMEKSVELFFNWMKSAQMRFKKNDFDSVTDPILFISTEFLEFLEHEKNYLPEIQKLLKK